MRKVPIRRQIQGIGRSGILFFLYVCVFSRYGTFLKNRDWVLLAYYSFFIFVFFRYGTFLKNKW